MVPIRCRCVQGVALLVLLLCGRPLVFAQRRPQADPAVTQLGSGFRSHKAQVSSTTLHYVRGGVGAAMLCVHGFPQDGTACRHILPPLARQCPVIAVD
jgi:hypothetical protein